MMRTEFSKKTRLEAWARCGGRCECGCRQKILGIPEYDHIIPAAMGGSNDLKNCQVLSAKCHRRKTSDADVPTISKAVRTIEKNAGVRKSRRPFPKRADPWGKGREW